MLRSLCRKICVSLLQIPNDFDVNARDTGYGIRDTGYRNALLGTIKCSTSIADCVSLLPMTCTVLG